LILHLSMDKKLLSQYEAIADGLISDGISITDDFLSGGEVTEILNADEFKKGLKQFKQAGIGKLHEKQISESIRGDHIQWINPETASLPIQSYVSKLTSLMKFLNEALFLSLKDVEVHMTVYPVGSFYKRHLDQFKKDDHRKLSVICYLNNNWMEDEGGQLRVYLPEGPKDFFPSAGKLICFRSDLLEHEVLPATRDRLSITGWMLDVQIG
jgi:SM-20-related protein